MRIRLFRNYGGRLTKEARLPPGVYDTDDLAKYPGLVDHLLGSDQAEVLPDETPLSLDPPPPSAETPAPGFLTHEELLERQERPIAENSPHVPTDDIVAEPTPPRKHKGRNV